MMANYLEDLLCGDALKDWEEKKKEHIQAFDVSEEEIEQLKKEGRI